MKVRKGDNVYIKAGKDRGASGQVVRVFPDGLRITVQGVNMYTKHIKPKRAGEKGQSVSVPRSMALSNVMVVCTACKKPTRVGYRMDGETKVRVCKQCNAAI